MTSPSPILPRARGGAVALAATALVAISCLAAPPAFADTIADAPSGTTPPIEDVENTDAEGGNASGDPSDGSMVVPGGDYPSGSADASKPVEGPGQDGSATRPGDAVHVTVSPLYGTWQKSSGRWWFSYYCGHYATGWRNIGGEWYYFDSNGWMKTGWRKTKSEWYYLSDSGAMETGWVRSRGSWYYLKPSGAMAIGWQQINGVWYYLKPSGAMAVNTWVGPYYVGASGAWVSEK